MNQIDLKIKLLSGQKILVDGIPIRPPTLSEISQIGYTTFQQNISLLMLSLDDMINTIDDFEMQATLKANRFQYKVFDLYMVSSELRQLLAETFKFLFNTEDVLIDDEDFGDIKIVIDESYVINRDNYDNIVEIIRMQNNPQISSENSDDDDDYKPANDLAKSIVDKIKKGKEIVRKSKAMDSKSDSEGITILDMISSVTAISNSINKLNVWDYTVYQLYEEFARLNKIENYRLQIQASMFSSEIEIEHWSEPL